ncbi:type I-E CRISPR-associated endoribonuclease Cas2e [Streptomyces sp. JNUCC 64]
MTVIVLAKCPAGLRGLLTRWLLEISPGVFLGSPSARVRQVLWDEVRTYADQGRALLAYQTDTEQGFTFETHEHAWEPVDHEGLTLIRRRPPGGRRGGSGSWTPADDRDPRSPEGPSGPPPQRGWSKASKRRRFGGGR